MTVSKRLVMAFVSIGILVLALTAVAWSVMAGLREMLSAGPLTAQQSQSLMAELERARWWLLVLGGCACMACVWSWVSLRRRIVAPLQEAIQIAEIVAAGDLSKEFSSTAEGEFGRLLTALSTMEDTLTELVSRIKLSTDALVVSAFEIDAGHSNLSSRTEQQVSALTETAASLAQLTVTVQQNAERAHSASSLAVTASATAGRGGEVVDQVVRTMESISSSSRKIVDIIQVIEGIAFQTNILALNAAVEAARAGEQGRGFAVVASEVRSLAQRSAEAAKQIQVLITASVTEVASGSALVGQAGSTMQDIMQSVGQVTDLLSDISVALQEQSEGIAQVNAAVAHMDSTNQENAALVVQATQAAAALNVRAQDLQQAVGAFKLDDDAGVGDMCLSSARPAMAPADSGARSAPDWPHRSAGKSAAADARSTRPAAHSSQRQALSQSAS